MGHTQTNRANLLAVTESVHLIHHFRPGWQKVTGPTRLCQATCRQVTRRNGGMALARCYLVDPAWVDPRRARDVALLLNSGRRGCNRKWFVLPSPRVAAENDDVGALAENRANCGACPDCSDQRGTLSKLASKTRKRTQSNLMQSNKN